MYWVPIYEIAQRSYVPILLVKTTIPLENVHTLGVPLRKQPPSKVWKRPWSFSYDTYQRYYKHLWLPSETDIKRAWHVIWWRHYDVFRSNKWHLFWKQPPHFENVLPLGVPLRKQPPSKVWKRPWLFSLTIWVLDIDIRSAKGEPRYMVLTLDLMEPSSLLVESESERDYQ